MGKLFEALGLSTEANALRAENQLSNKVVPGAFFICCMVTALLPPAQLKSINLRSQHPSWMNILRPMLLLSLSFVNKAKDTKTESELYSKTIALASHVVHTT